MEQELHLARAQISVPVEDVLHRGLLSQQRVGCQVLAANQGVRRQHQVELRLRVSQPQPEAILPIG